MIPVSEVMHEVMRRHNEAIAVIRAIVCRHRAFTDASERGAAREMILAADEVHAAIGAAEKYLERIENN
jgi:hypothetical protein